MFADRDAGTFRLFVLICTVVPFVSCGVVLVNMCMTSHLLPDGSISPAWALSQCPPPPTSYDDVRGWQGNATWADYFE